MRPVQSSERAVAGVLVAAACGLQLAVMGRATLGLAAVLTACFGVWLGRSEWGPARGVLPAYAAAVLVQCVHLAEEYRASFHARFPPLFGAAAWPPLRFMAFNLAWLAVFALAGLGIARGSRLAHLAALFLALGGGVVNGAAHLGLVVLTGGYFPGAYTAPLALAAGAALAYRLLRPATPAAAPSSR